VASSKWFELSSFPQSLWEDWLVVAAILPLLLWLQAAPFVPGGISGELRTTDGALAVGVRVVVMPVPTGTTVVDEGPNYFNLAPPTSATLTDNEGKFALLDLRPGRYYLMAGAAGQATFFPDSPDIRKAQIFEVNSGYLLDNANFRLLHRLGGRLNGRVNADMKTLGTRTATIVGGKLDEVLEVPVRPDGSFEFGHVPPGNYLVSLYPPTPGIASVPIRVGDEDVTGVELVPLPTKKVSGRIIVKNGPIPRGILGFYTIKTYVSASVKQDGTFEVDLHDANHQLDFAGLPVGYYVTSVRVGSQDGSKGIVVKNADVSNVVITLEAPRRLAVLRGRITGLAPGRYASTIVDLAGPIFNRLQADVQQDGTFEFPAVTPGLYTLTLPGVEALKPMTVVIDGPNAFTVNVTVPSPQ
jgi:hypothetical protein